MLNVELMVGLVGFSLVITASQGLSWFKEWAESRAWSPWHWLAAGMEDSLLVGFCVGFAWSAASPMPWYDVVSSAGVIGLATFFVDGVLSILHATTQRILRKPQQPQPRQMQMPTGYGGGRPRVDDPDRSEGDAHDIIDKHDSADI
jgi:hypothetical protein